MKTKAILSLALGFLSLAPLNAQVWPHEASDLRADGKAVFGRLENGMRYVIYPGAGATPGQASLRLYVNVGSLMEQNHESGIANFLEHMATSETNRFAPRASTSFDHTVYKLDLPKADAAALRESFAFFRACLDGMPLEHTKVDNKREEILSELRGIQNIGLRTMQASLKFALPYSIIGDRFPLGSKEVVKSVSRANLMNFHARWYTPERAVAVVVGDVVPSQVKQMIEAEFGSLPVRKQQFPEPALGNVRPGQGLVAGLHTEMEAPHVNVTLQVLKPVDDTPDSLGRRTQRLTRNLGTQLLVQRVNRIIQGGKSPVLSVQGDTSDVLKFVESNSLSATTQPANWQATLSILEQEVRRAVTEGFTQNEFEVVRAKLGESVRAFAAQQATRPHSATADWIVTSLSEGKVLTSMEEDANLIAATLKYITAEDCRDSLRAVWQTSDLNIFVSGNLKLEEASKMIAQAYQSSVRQALAPLPALAVEAAKPLLSTTSAPAQKPVVAQVKRVVAPVQVRHVSSRVVHTAAATPVSQTQMRYTRQQVMPPVYINVRPMSHSHCSPGMHRGPSPSCGR